MPIAAPSHHTGATSDRSPSDRSANTRTPTVEVAAVHARAAGATVGDRVAAHDEYRRKQRAPADAVEPAQHAHREAQHAQGRRPERGSRPRPLGQKQPDAEWQQHDRGDRVERPTAWKELDARHRAHGDARQRSHEQSPQERRSQPVLLRQPNERTRGRDDVVEQVRRRERGGSDLQDARLEREQEHCTGHPDRGRHEGQGECGRRAKEGICHAKVH